jgi:integrase
MTLKLVTTRTVPNHKQQYLLPDEWEKSIESWLKWLRIGGMMPNSIKLRRGAVRVVAKRSRTERPGEVTVAILTDVCGNADWSNEYRKIIRQSLVSYFEWAVGQRLAAENVALVALPKVQPPPPNPRPAPDSVWFGLLDKAEPRVKLMAQLAGEAGMRRAEVACSHSDDLLEGMDGFSLIVHGKGGKQRVVPITDSLAKAIMDYRLDKGITGYLFPKDERWGRTGHLSAAYVGDLISSHMPAGWTMHKLRHRYATRGHMGTNNLRAVQEALGHTSVATTQKYVAVSQNEIRAVSEAAFKARS